MYPYKFSIVMAAYNVEAYLDEAIESLQEQTIGFDDIQVILVDDGSTDNTAAICDSYAAQYDNILALHQTNQGVSSARNLGLTKVSGQFVNFMDSDDKLSADTLEHVYTFFSAHEAETDVTVIPMIYFDGQSNEHRLNFYKKTTCIADLEEHPDYVAMSMSCSFVRAEAASTIHFDTRLAYAEDARALVSILLVKRKLGIVSDAVYWYRHRSNGITSAMGNAHNNPAWYQPHLDHFSLAIIRQCLDTYGAVPAFVQYTLAYDLQPPLKVDSIPSGIMSEAEQKHYLETLFSIYNYIDDKIILAQKHCFAEQKLFVLRNKHKELPDFIKKKNNILLTYNGETIYSLKRSLVTIDFIKIRGTRCSIEGTVNYFPTVMHEVRPYLLVNGKKHACRPTEHNENHYCLDHLVLTRQGFIGRFDIDPNDPVTEIQFMYIYDDMRVIPFKYKFGKFVPVETTFPEQYGIIGNYTVQFKENAIALEEATAQSVEDKEALFLSAVRNSGQYSEEDIALRTKARSLQKKSAVWMICDRYDQAGDNGEAFFRYLRKYHRFTVKPYFVLAKGSPDRERMEAIGPVVTYGSQEHKLLYLLSRFMISSHADDFILHPFAEQDPLYKDLTAQKNIVFLQHGVIQDDLSGWLNRYNKNFTGFVTTARPEYQSICDTSYGYPAENVWLTGLPRYDRLYNAPQKQITIMPTWRRNLLATLNEDNHWVALPGMADSAYVQFYKALFSHPKLQGTAKACGYTIAFKPHPAFTDFLPVFDVPDNVKVLGQDVTYRDAFAQSDLLLTDYSSVAFDFAYLRKPILYYQGDRDEFFSGEHICSLGYFDYERDGLGDVTYTLDETIDQLVAYMESGCQLKDKYCERIDHFYAFHDKKCCKRIYKEIRKAGKRKA